MKKMQRMKLILVAAAICLGGCGQYKPAAWVMTSSETDLMGRLGVVRDNTEIGLTAKYARTSEVPWGPEPDIAGGYLLFHLTQEVTIEDTPEPSPLKDFLEALHASPYAGLEIVGSVADDRLGDFQPNWIAGTKFTLDEGASWALVTEYTDGDQAAGQVYIGVMIRE